METPLTATAAGGMHPAGNLQGVRSMVTVCKLEQGGLGEDN